MSKLALLGGKKVVTRKAPRWPIFSQAAIRRVTAMLSKGRTISTSRDEAVAPFEDAFAKWHGVKYCVAVNSGTAALHSAVVGCGVAPGDEVITSPYSWGATTGCILHQGAVPIFADVLERNGLLDPDAVEACVTRRTRAIVVVHLYGQPADMRPLRRIARKHDLALIEDCSQAHGAGYRNKPVGTWGDAAGFSCMGGKLLGSVEGGAMLTGKRDIYDKAQLTGHHVSRTRSVAKRLLPYVDSLVWNYRPNTIGCILLADQLPHLKRWNKARVANRDLFVKLCSDIPFLRFPTYFSYERPSYHMTTFRYDRAKAKGVRRETFTAATAAEGAGCFCYVPSPIPLWRRMHPERCRDFPPMWAVPLLRAGVKYSKGTWPVAERLCAATALEMTFNNFTTYDPKMMQQLADALHKGADNLDALKQWEKRRGAAGR